MTNYIYGINTGYSNLRKHLANEHPAAYDKAILENGWNYRLSDEIKSGQPTTVEARKQSLPPFTHASFIDYLVRFVVADDQVSNTLSVTNLGAHPFQVDSRCRVS